MKTDCGKRVVLEFMNKQDFDFNQVYKEKLKDDKGYSVSFRGAAKLMIFEDNSDSLFETRFPFRYTFDIHYDK
jgi:hypothetical protein